MHPWPQLSSRPRTLHSHPRTIWAAVARFSTRSFSTRAIQLRQARTATGALDYLQRVMSCVRSRQQSSSTIRSRRFEAFFASNCATGGGHIDFAPAQRRGDSSHRDSTPGSLAVGSLEAQTSVCSSASPSWRLQAATSLNGPHHAPRRRRNRRTPSGTAATPTRWWTR